MFADASFMLRTGDSITLGIYLIVVLALGVWSMTKTQTTEGYFFGGRSMPGWAVAISVLGTAISSVTFLAYPGSAYAGNWSMLAQGLSIPIAAVITVIFIVPFYRDHAYRSAYEYFEARFGTTWPRTYSSVLWSLSMIWRMGSILYLLCLPFQAITGWEPSATILAVGTFVVLYTVIGGIEAVIWTDTIQTVVLILGGVAVAITVLAKIGAGPVFAVGAAEGKFSVNLSLNEFSLARDTFWAIILSGIVNNFHEFAVDQTKIQRYLAPKTKRGAVGAVWTGALGSIPVWTLFMFVGTCLFVFYRQHADRLPEGMIADQVFPYFILHELPEGLGGFVIAAVLGAAMSSIDSALNGSSSTITNDLYRRLLVKNRSDAHYLWTARIMTLALGAAMMGLAFLLTLAAQETFLELGLTVAGLLSGGLGGMFFLAFFTTRTNNVGIIFGIIGGIMLSAYFVVAESKGIPMTSIRFEDMGPPFVYRLLFGAAANFLVILLAYPISYLAPARSDESLKNLTWWTLEKKETAET